MDVLTQAEAEAITQRVMSMITVPDPKVTVYVFGDVEVENTFARSEVRVARETQRVGAQVLIASDGRMANARVTQVDDATLRLMVREAELLYNDYPKSDFPPWLMPPQSYAKPAQLRFASTTDAMAVERRSAVTRHMLEKMEARRLLGGGRNTLRLSFTNLFNTDGLKGYVTQTYAESSVNARTTDGKGSGWGWTGHADWARVDVDAATDRAIDLAERSAKPVAVEPGRYTVILEPAAIADLMWWLVGNAPAADFGGTPFSATPIGTNKRGLKMLDERFTVDTDLWDPRMPLPTIGLSNGGAAMANETWFDRGIVNAMYMDGIYAKEHGFPRAVPFPDGLRLYGRGPTQSLEEMIATTKRGIWVNRFGNIASMSYRSALMTGTTRDGTFLIENGKITKAIKNLRFMESIFFILNHVESFGDPVRASPTMIAPRVKARDFDFTSLTDAI